MVIARNFHAPVALPSITTPATRVTPGPAQYPKPSLSTLLRSRSLRGPPACFTAWPCFPHTPGGEWLPAVSLPLPPPGKRTEEGPASNSYHPASSGSLIWDLPWDLFPSWLPSLNFARYGFLHSATYPGRSSLFNRLLRIVTIFFGVFAGTCPRITIRDVRHPSEKPSQESE